VLVNTQIIAKWRLRAKRKPQPEHSLPQAAISNGEKQKPQQPTGSRVVLQARKPASLQVDKPQ